MNTQTRKYDFSLTCHGIEVPDSGQVVIDGQKGRRSQLKRFIRQVNRHTSVYTRTLTSTAGASFDTHDTCTRKLVKFLGDAQTVTTTANFDLPSTSKRVEREDASYDHKEHRPPSVRIEEETELGYSVENGDRNVQPDSAHGHRIPSTIPTVRYSPVSRSIR